MNKLVIVLVISLLLLVFINSVLVLSSQKQTFTNEVYLPCPDGCTQDVYDARVAKWNIQHGVG